jgi:extracellular elastinolytic metalloproteinase
MRYIRAVALTTMAALIALAASHLEAQSARQFEPPRARIVRANRGQVLSSPSNASHAAIVAQYLRDHGRSDATVRSLVALGQSRPKNGLSHSRFEQRVAGLKVYATYLKAAIDGQGALLHVIENLAPVPAGGVGRAQIDEQAALRVALQRLHPGVAAPGLAGKDGDAVVFARTEFFHAGPRVTRVAVPDAGGGLTTGFLVETWSQKANLLNHTLVDGNGAVLEIERRTNTDKYRVFRVDPISTDAQVVSGPAPDPNAPSPSGWLGSGAQSTINIAGNNVRAYLDVNANDTADGGGTPVTNGSFLSALDDTITPKDPTNRNVAVQNLFYLNNVLHDTLFDLGFDEAAGNFQETNFTGARGGSDSVNAEAQDGGSTDNADFATPADGRNPRMQMYLWTGLPSHQVVVSGTAYDAAAAVFGKQLTAGAPLTGNLAVGTDGTGVSLSDGCEAITSNVANSIAIVDRGNCDFTVKAKNAQVAGAIGVLVANLTDSVIVLGGTDSTVTIPALCVGVTSGSALKAAAGQSATMRVTDPTPLQRDGDLDSDIVYHEYGHGLTWRMIGRMSGALAGAVGEGMSDVLAILLNDNDRVGEYSASDPVGIRRNPYTGYPRTYANVTGEEVHADGEIYAAIGWRMLENFKRAGVAGPNRRLLGYLVQGMNFTPAQPSYEQMRDGILQAVTDSTHACLVWDAFADFGVGVGAKGVAQGSKAVITPSKALPSECVAVP